MLNELTSNDGKLCLTLNAVLDVSDFSKHSHKTDVLLLHTVISLHFDTIKINKLPVMKIKQRYLYNNKAV